MPDIWMDVDTSVIVPVNILPLLDDTDFKSIETAVVYNSAGLVVTWNFVTAARVVSGTAITPTTGGVYDWSEPIADKGMYAIEIPASGGGSANNDTEGTGWITGVATGVLPWRGPTIGFRRAALNDMFMDGSTASTNFEDFFDGTGYAGGTAKLTVDGGWNQVLWKEQRFPTARELDGVIADRPAVLARVDGHAIWVNSAALRAAGITAATVDPPGGQILRDGDGNPSGVLIDAATTLLERHIPPASDEETKRALRAAMQELVSLGMTGVHDAGIDSRQYCLYQELGAAGELQLRMYAMLADSALLADSQEARRVMQAGPRMPQFDDRLQMRAVKALVDGALGSRGAALLEDYSDQPHHRGLRLYTREQLHELATLAGSSGWQLNIHAIGDAGNRAVLDTFEVLLTKDQRRSLRPRVRRGGPRQRLAVAVAAGREPAGHGGGRAGLVLAARRRPDRRRKTCCPG